MKPNGELVLLLKGEEVGKNRWIYTRGLVQTTRVGEQLSG